MENTGTPITLADLYEAKIFETTHLCEPHWMQDCRRFSYLDKAPNSEVTTLWCYDADSGERTVVIEPSALSLPKEGAKHLAIKHYAWSPDESAVLFASRQGHRSFGAGDKEIFAYFLAEGELRLVAKDEKPHLNVKWSPDSKRVGYVKGDDLYVSVAGEKGEIRLTNTAQEALYNGRFGWVYEEELYLTDGWEWSPNGKQIAFFEVDERLVPEVLISNYDDLHSTPIRTRYPKAGDPNPIVRIGVIDVPDADTGKVPPTRWVDIGNDPDVYIARMQWTPQGDLLLQRIPRLQNRLELLRVDPKTGASRVILVEEDRAWVEAPGDVKFVEGADQFLWESDRSGFKHLYLYDLNGKLLNQVSSGDWEIDSLVGLDSEHRQVYFTAAHPHPTERHLYACLLDGGGEMVRLSEESGVHRPLFASDGRLYLNTHSNRMTPPQTSLCRASGQKIRVVHENSMPKLAGKFVSAWEMVSFKTSDGVTLNAKIMKPANFDPKRRYPVLMYTYGGPGSQVVKEQFEGGWEQVLVQKGYILARVDGRGSGGRGRDFLKVTYQNLGYWEVHDQIEGAKWLSKMGFVDGKRIGIWGWSYGGYMATYAILKGASTFKTAIAVAPVTDWHLYDSIYTERYMRRPKDNPKGYESSAPLKMTDLLQGKFLLVHGMADDNVHFQNSARLAQEFQKQGKVFETMYYPGKHHGIEGVGLHLYSLMTDFILENL